MRANIWIYEDRIVYVGEQLPLKMLKIVKSLIVQMKLLFQDILNHMPIHFNYIIPILIAAYASQFGTTTLINDNMALILNLKKKEAFSLLKDLRSIPATMFWWCRFDPQTEILNEEEIFSHSNIKSWLRA